MVELAYAWVGLVGGGEAGRGWVGFGGSGGWTGPGRSGRVQAGCAEVGGLYPCGRLVDVTRAARSRRSGVRPGRRVGAGASRDADRLMRVPTAARSRWSGVRPGRCGGRPAMRSSDAGFKTSQGSACNVCPAPRRVASWRRCSRAARTGCAAVRPTPGAGGASGAAWSTWPHHMAGHHRCEGGGRAGRHLGGTGVYRGQRLGRGLPLALSPCAEGVRGCGRGRVRAGCRRRFRWRLRPWLRLRFRRPRGDRYRFRHWHGVRSVGAVGALSCPCGVVRKRRRRPRPRGAWNWVACRAGGRYWDRTSDLFGVNEALSR